MKQFSFHSLTRSLSSRLALNIYFWIFMILVKYSDADDQHTFSKWVYYGLMVFYMLFFALLSYVNNFLLLPKLLLNKKRVLYFCSALALVLTTAFVYTWFIKYLGEVFDKEAALEMSMVMSPVTTDSSFSGVLNDISTYFSIMVVWLTVFCLLGLYHYNLKKVKLLQETINKHREAELTFLKNQIHPHFLFNTLNNLYALSLKKSDETPESILKLSSVLRYMIYEANAPLVLFSKEKEVIQAYVDIEMLRLPDSPHLQFSLLSDKDYFIPPLIWLPILENVFKHTRMVDELEIDFRLSVKENKLHLYCKNNLSLAGVSDKKEAGGIGLTNLKKRLELLYPAKHKISTDKQSGYFTMELDIDLV